MKVRTVLIALVLVGVASVGVAAQERASRSREVAVALVDTLSKPGLRAEIVRFSDAGRRDIILLPRDASADVLAAALMAYRESGTRIPARAGLVGRVSVSDLEVGGPGAAAMRARATVMLAKVRSAGPSRIGNYGQGRWSTFRVTIGD